MYAKNLEVGQAVTLGIPGKTTNTLLVVPALKLCSFTIPAKGKKLTVVSAVWSYVLEVHLFPLRFPATGEKVMGT